MSLLLGLQKSSLLDYPGKISAVVFTYGCNLRCPFCHNPELVIEKPSELLLSVDEVLGFLQSRVGLLDAIVLTGGEPLIHSEVYDFLIKIKQMGFSIKVDTNGFFPKSIKKLMDLKIVDFWAMDIKNSEEEYLNTVGLLMDSNTEGFISKIIESVDLIMNSGVDYEFRTTFVPGFHTEKSVQNLGNIIKGAKRFAIQNFRSGKVLDTVLNDRNGFTEMQLNGFKNILNGYVENIIVRN
jgi:pyruvate formate lyase activating enzyme